MQSVFVPASMAMMRCKNMNNKEVLSKEIIRRYEEA